MGGLLVAHELGSEFVLNLPGLPTRVRARGRRRVSKKSVVWGPRRGMVPDLVSGCEAIVVTTSLLSM
jgi:hypothetical protein